MENWGWTDFNCNIQLEMRRGQRELIMRITRAVRMGPRVVTSLTSRLRRSQMRSRGKKLQTKSLVDPLELARELIVPTSS
jgi:hypothetical protein